MEQFLQHFLLFALLAAPVYAIAASGLVVTYTTTGIFNFAHGAIGMIVAFCYWQITDAGAWGLPVPLGLVLCLFVIAPAIGWGLDRVLFRRLAGSSTITTIVATIGLLFALVSVANIVWPSGTSLRKVQPLFPGKTITILDYNVTWHSIIALIAAIAVAIGLRALLFGTRRGTAMRAVVDNRELTALTAADPNRVSATAWMLGCGLAGLAGILVAPGLSFTSVALTLVVIDAYAVAMVGRLRSLPMTFVGAVILAELNSLIDYIQVNEWGGSLSASLDDVGAAAPVIMLLVVLIVMKPDRAALLPDNIRFRVPRPSMGSVGRMGGVLVLVAAALASFDLLDQKYIDDLGKGLAFGIVMLSLVLLTGWAGQISLTQLALGGLAALAVWKLGPVVGLVAGVLIAAVVGALVALPALRMRTLYLALLTMAFALLMEKVIYGDNALIPAFQAFSQGNATAERPPGLQSDDAFFIALAAVFALVSLGLTVIRNGHFGRRLAAMKDSPGACATLGLDLTVTKLQVFALAAGIAGLGGGLLAMWNSASIGKNDYALLNESGLAGLPLLLVAVIGGITSVAGALTGAVLFVGMPIIGERFAWMPGVSNLMKLAPGLAGIGLAKHPDGAAHQVSEAIAESRARREAAERDPLSRPEQLGASGRITPDEAARLDDELGLSWYR